MNLLLIVALDWVYVFGVAPIRCAYQKGHLKTLLVTWVTLVGACGCFISLIRNKTGPPSSAVATGDDEMIAPLIDLNKESARKFVTDLIPIGLYSHRRHSRGD